MAQLPWHTSVSILVAGGLVAGAIYLALRPSTSSQTTAGSPTEPTVRKGDRSAAISPMAERDRQRHWDALAQAEEDEPATPRDPEVPRSADAISEADRAMAVAPPLPGSPTPHNLTERVQRDASEAFDGIRKRVRADCWDTLPDDPDAPEAVNVTLSLSYGADGKLLASGISESRESHRPGLAACLGPLIQELEVPAPGSNLSIELSVAIP